RRRLPLRIAVLLGVAAGAAIGALFAFSYFSSTSPAQANTVTAGSIPQGNTPSASVSPPTSPDVTITFQTVSVGATQISNYTVTVSAVTITLSPTSGHVGDSVSISGSGFPASTSLSATYDGNSLTLGGTTSTDGSGSFSGATFTVPVSTAGSHTVQVTAGARS